MGYSCASGDFAAARRKTFRQAVEGPQDPDMAAVEKEVIKR